jgi:hypothetical protein
MRTGALLFAFIGLTLAAACNGPGPDDEECTAQGGVCVSSADQAACGGQLTTPAGTCPASYTCCVPLASDAGTSAPPATPPAADAAPSKS